MWRLIEMARKWLGNIRGPKGPQGEKGEKGPQGPQGIQGPKGEKGDIPNMDLYVKADKVYTKEEINQKLKELPIPKVTDVYSKKEVDEKFQLKGDYALKSDIPKAQDLTPYAKKSDIYQENMIKLPDGTLIGIETKSGGVNNNSTPPGPNIPEEHYPELKPDDDGTIPPDDVVVPDFSPKPKHP